jgi:hypothetical protein
VARRHREGGGGARMEGTTPPAPARLPARQPARQWGQLLETQPAGAGRPGWISYPAPGSRWGRIPEARCLPAGRLGEKGCRALEVSGGGRRRVFRPPLPSPSWRRRRRCPGKAASPHGVKAGQGARVPSITSPPEPPPSRPRPSPLHHVPARAPSITSPPEPPPSRPRPSPQASPPGDSRRPPPRPRPSPQAARETRARCGARGPGGRGDGACVCVGDGAHSPS